MDDDLNELASKLAPILATRLLLENSYFGDPEKVKIAKYAKIRGAHFNVSSGEIHIGRFTFTGYNAAFITGTHPISKKYRERQGFPKLGNDIIVGEGVWIGSSVTILGPCKIGDHAVIAAGSVVLPGIYEEGHLYAGVPAKKKKKIDFTEEDL